MFTDMPLERYIQVLLDVPPNRRTGYITKLTPDELRFFIAGEDGIVLINRPPLIARRGLSPIPNVVVGEIQLALWRLMAEGQVKRFGRWYAWASVAGPKARLKSALYAPVLGLRLRRLAKQGQALLEGETPEPLVRDVTQQRLPPDA